jgi:hypothetical protein
MPRKAAVAAKQFAKNGHQLFGAAIAARLRHTKVHRYNSNFKGAQLTLAATKSKLEFLLTALRRRLRGR